MMVVNDLLETLGAINTSDGLFAVDADQHVVFWNDSAEGLLGYSAAEVLDMPCYDVLGGRDAQNNRFCRSNCPVVINARRGRTTSDYDVRSLTRYGEDRWVNVSVMVLKRKQDRRPYVVHLLRDVTERRRVEELARRAMDALRELAADSEETAASDEFPDSRPTPLPALSPREREVLRLLALGFSTQQIAEHLGISPVTARNHITHVISKLGARTRLQAVLYASKRQLI